MGILALLKEKIHYLLSFNSRLLKLLIHLDKPTATLTPPLAHLTAPLSHKLQTPSLQFTGEDASNIQVKYFGLNYQHKKCQ